MIRMPSPRCARKLSQFDCCENCSESIGGELGGVDGGRRESAELSGDTFRGDSAGIGDIFADEFFGEERSAGDCRSTALAEETRFGDASVFDSSGEMQNVSADRVGNFDGGGGVGEFADVARIFEVIEDGVAEHAFQYGKNPMRNSRTDIKK